MTNITEANQFDANVKFYDLTDPVVGALTGESNMPVIALTNRTRFLYNYLNGHASVASVTANATIDATYLRKLVFVNISSNITITLAALSNFIDGQKLNFIVKTTGVKCAKFVPSDGTIINLPAGYTGLWLHDGEQIELERVSGTQWWLHDIKTNLNNVGNDGMLRFMEPNTIVAQGTSGLARADMARLWDRVVTNAVGDSTWLGDPITYRCMFSAGNGSTTFRIPDMRSISWRGLDLARGISTARIGTTAGSFEADGNKSHTHTFLTGGDFTIDANPQGKPLGRQNDDAVSTNITTSASGNTEATIKNAGLIPVIYY